MDLPSLIVSEERTLRENNGVLEEGITDDMVKDDGIIYPRIFIDPDSILRPTLCHYLRPSDIFVEKPFSLLMKAFYICQKKGLKSSLEFISNSIGDDTDSQDDISWGRYLLCHFTRIILKIWNLVLFVYVYFYPFALFSNQELMIKFSKSTDWQESLIRSFVWHPKLYKFAYCLVNDIVYVHSIGSNSSKNSNTIQLRNSHQKKVTRMTWHPINDDMLGVSTEKAIFIWTIAGSQSSVRIIKDYITSPITSITFDPSGDSVCFCTPQSSRIYIHKIDYEVGKENEAVKLVWRFGSCFTHLLWSPDQMRLLAGTTSNYIRVFENKNWSSKYWPINLCQAACWSYDGKILLLATSDECSIYALTFYDPCQPDDVGGSNNLIKVTDTEEVTLDDGNIIGGRINDLAWDQSSQRLAVLFKDNPMFIALYETKVKPTLEIDYIGFVHGKPDEVPMLISFHYAFTKGSLLTVCWSSGFVSFIPLIYSKKKDLERANGSIRSIDSLSFFTSKYANGSMNESLFINSFSSPRRTPVKPSTPNNHADSVVAQRRPYLFSRRN